MTPITMTLVGMLALLLTLHGVPWLLQRMGLNPHPPERSFDLAGRRALLVATSRNQRASGTRTGVWASEMTVPYYLFREAGMEVDLASVEGGTIPIDPASLRWPVTTPSDRRYRADNELQAKAKDSAAVADLDPRAYDLIFLAGGSGAAYDLWRSEALGRALSEAYAEGAVIGGVDHGPLGLLLAEDEEGRPLVEGRRVTALTDKQISELGREDEPLHPEQALREAGADFRSASAWRDAFASLVVEDGRMVTGQNQNASAEVAQAMMARLARDGAAPPSPDLRDG